MLKTFTFLILTGLLLNSCDDYCDYQFSEEFFPLSVGNIWVYDGGGGINGYTKWQIINSYYESDMKKFEMTFFDLNDNQFAEELVYYYGKKLYTTIPFYYNLTNKNKEYMLIDFSLEEGEIYTVGDNGYQGVILSKSSNVVTFGIIPNYSEDDIWELQISLQRGVGISEYFYLNAWAKNTLTKYTIN